MSTPLPVTVLSYNISFEAMTNKSNPKFSAAALGKKCIPTSHNPRLTICAEHMAHTIDGVAASIKVPSLDFIALQEASRWDVLQKASAALTKMKAINSIQGYTEMATFYDASKYKLSHTPYLGGYNKERPFQILVFKNLFDASGTIFINTHNPHPQEMPSYHFDFNDMNVHLSKAVATMGLSDDEKSYRIIAARDFNETGWNGIIMGTTYSWIPFEDAKIGTSLSIGKNPVYSCCKGNGNWDDGRGGLAKGHRGGDYIFDSKAAANIEVPPGYGPLELQSDHLPVTAVL